MVNKKYYTGIILTFMCLFWSANLSALEVTASVDKNPVMLDEAITLVVKATGEVDRNAFQSDALLKDFIVGNTSVSSQTQMINFDTTRSTTWRTTLFPKEEGTFVIPALEVNGVKTQPISVRVLPVPTATTQEQRDFFVTAELEQNSAFVQQHVNYTVKLYMAANIERGSLQAPEMEGGRIEQVGDDTQYSDIVNGKRFQVVERTFVVIPEQSGQFSIQAPIFSGEVLATNTRQSFGFFNRTRNITRRGPQLTLDVKPIPPSATGTWLPSRFVDISESWPENKTFVVGEPITRTLTLTVEGQSEEQLPEIPQIYPPSVKTYQDQAETKSAEQDGRILAQRIESTAIIPTEEGTMVLPGVEVPWFNVETQQVEIAQIPAKTVQVGPAVGLQSTPAMQVPTIENTSDSEPASTVTIQGQDISGELFIWKVLSAVFAAMWLLTLIAWWRGRSGVAAKQTGNTAPPQIKTDKSALIRAVESADTSQLQPLLWAWLNSTLAQEFTSLHQALNHPDAKNIKTQFQALTAAKFSASGERWSPEHFKKAISDLESQRSKHSKHSQGSLPELFPATQ